MPPADAPTVSVTRIAVAASETDGANVSSAGSSPAAVSIATACGCTVMSATGACSRATSRRLPPHRTRVTSAPPSDGAAVMQLAASGTSRSAAAWAMTSLPRSVPGPTTAVAPSRPASSTIASAIACGAYEAKTSPSATCSVDTPWSASAARGACDCIVTSGNGLHLASAPVGAREGERLQRRLVDLARGVLEVDEDAHATPICWSTSTTRGAAAAPSPSTSACLPSPSGTTSRSFSSRCSGRAGVRASSGFRCARSRPGTDG